MQKYYAIDLSTADGPMRAAVYRADDVDKYRNDSVDINDAAGRELKRLRAALEVYTHCRHACIDCDCTKEAKAALY